VWRVTRNADLDTVVEQDLPGAEELAAVDAGPRRLSTRSLAVLLVVLGAVGFAASGWLAIERYLTLVNPDHALSCSLNVFVDCGAAMNSWQGRLLGFPNPYLGVAAFPVVITTGVVLLAGFRAPRWYRLGLLAGTVLGEVLVFFLMWTSLYALVSLCIYCMVVWTVMWPLLWYQLVHAVQLGDVRLPDGVARAVVGNRGVLLAAGYVAAVAWILGVMGRHLAASF
jgi:uncharacterized membrane protein